MTTRRATPADLAALIRIETQAFAGDRISRRSFRRFLDAETASCLVAERKAGDGAGEILGYVLLLFRRGTALARLYSLALAPSVQGLGYGRALLAAAEADAFERERLVLRLEVREDNAAARALYERAGYRPHGRIANYYEDGCAALRMEKLLYGARPPRAAPPFLPQSTEFTCGPACLMMALAHFDPATPAGARLELRLWREATTIFLAAGHGGCGPYGLAVAAAKRGLSVEVRLSPPGPVFLSSVRDPAKRRVMEIVQADYRDEAAALGIPARDDPLDARGLAEAVAGGALAIVLISENVMFARRGAHWLLVHGCDARHLFVHDPWLGGEGLETAQDAGTLPIPLDTFDRMARWGKPPVRAQILLRKV